MSAIDANPEVEFNEDDPREDVSNQPAGSESVSALPTGKDRISIRTLLDEVSNRPSDRTVKIHLSRLDVKQIRRMAKTLRAPHSIHRTRKSATEWLMKWASDQRSSKLLAAAGRVSQFQSAAPLAALRYPEPHSEVRNFAPQYYTSSSKAPPLNLRLPRRTADHVDRIHRQQHQQLLTHMTCPTPHSENGLPTISAASSSSLLSAQIQCSAASHKLEQLIELGHLQSRADLAWLLLDGREGVPKNAIRAFELADYGAGMSCPHCIGVLACCYWGGLGCGLDKSLSLELARASAAEGSRYGFWTLGVMHRLGEGGAPRDYQQALQLFNMAAVLNLDAAQFMLGYAYFYGLGIVEDHAQALRWFVMAAAQGHPDSCYMVGRCMELTNGGAVGRTSAISWYQRACASGHPESSLELYGSS